MQRYEDSCYGDGDDVIRIRDMQSQDSPDTCLQSEFPNQLPQRKKDDFAWWFCTAMGSMWNSWFLTSKRGHSQKRYKQVIWLVFFRFIKTDKSCRYIYLSVFENSWCSKSHKCSLALELLGIVFRCDALSRDYSTHRWQLIPQRIHVSYLNFYQALDMPSLPLGDQLCLLLTRLYHLSHRPKRTAQASEHLWQLWHP